MTAFKFIKKVTRFSCNKSMKQYFWNLTVNGCLMSYLVPVWLRRFILNIMGAQVKGAIHGHCTLLKTKLALGKKSFINRNCFIDNNEMVTIGNNCSIGYNVVIATTNHSMECSCRGGNLSFASWDTRWLLDRREQHHPTGNCDSKRLRNSSRQYRQGNMWGGQPVRRNTGNQKKRFTERWWKINQKSSIVCTD